MGLRRILDFAKNTRSPSLELHKLHVLYHVEQGPLKDEYFSVYVCKNSSGSINFHHKSQDKKNKRSLRHQRNGKTVQCDQLRKDGNCFKFGFHGICAQGTARISSWLQYALKLKENFKWTSLLIVCSFITLSITEPAVMVI